MGVFHWGHLVGNCGFFEGREQCLQSQLGLIVDSQLVAVDQHISDMFNISPTLNNSVSRPWICPSGNRHVVGLYGLSDTLLSCPIL